MKKIRIISPVLGLHCHVPYNPQIVVCLETYDYRYERQN